MENTKTNTNTKGNTKNNTKAKETPAPASVQTPPAKPTLVARQEFIDALLSLINSSGLPMIMIQPVMVDVTNNVNELVRKQYESEKSEYESALTASQPNQ